MGPSVKTVLTIYLNGSMQLNKMAIAGPYMVKRLKNLLLQNRESFEAESWYIASGTQGLSSLFKWWWKVDLWSFYSKVKFAPHMHLYGGNIEMSFSQNVLNSRPWWLSWMRRLTGDQEVADSTPAEVGNILSWRLIWNIFYGHSLPSADSRRADVSFWWKNVHNTG